MIPSSLSEKQKDALAQAQLMQIHGKGYFRFSLAERAEMRTRQRIAMEQAERTPLPNAVHTPNTITQPDYAEFKNQERQPDSAEFTAYKDDALAPQPAKRTEHPLQPLDVFVPPKPQKHESFSLSIELNAKQTIAAEYGDSGKSYVITGAAGTGKTTVCREVARRAVAAGSLGEHDFKVSGGERVLAPAIAFCAFTNRATDNMRRALHKDTELERELMFNVLTIHKLLEFEPVFYDVEDQKTGEMHTTMRFEPQRHAKNPLRIKKLIMEESSMVGTDLGIKLMDALPKGCQIIYVGDINQLPPIFAKSMLNYALTLLPVVELTEVYRQALESPIIFNAHNVLAGRPIEDKRPFFQVVSGKALSKIPGESICVNQLVNSLKSWYNTTQDDGSRKYDPELDIVLSPWNKQEAGTNNINSHIAQFLGQDRKALIYEVYAGMRKLYLAVGDRVMVSKQDGYITKISHNGHYLGRMPRPANTELTRFGMQLVGNKEAEHEDLELSLSSYAALNVDSIPDSAEEKKQDASHVVYVKLDTGVEISLDSVGEFSEVNFTLGYALTVHKAQGCEWRKVFIMMHRNHAISLNREMLYTAITRAREYCIIVDLCNMIEKAIASQRILGNSVEEKIEWFNSEISLAEPVAVVPYHDFEEKPLPSDAKRHATPKIQPAPVIAASVHAPVTLVRLCDLIDENLAGEYYAKLVQRWNDAWKIWGDRISGCPKIDFNLQRSKIIGLANLKDHTIKLNPLWVLLGNTNPDIQDQMLGETLDHEIAHLVAWRFSQDTGHDSGWRMAMKLLGREPKVFATSEDLPSWTVNYKSLMEDLRAKLNGKANLDDDYVNNEGDQI